MKINILESSGSPFNFASSSGMEHDNNPLKFEWCHDKDSDSPCIVWMDYNHRGGFTYTGNKKKFLWLCESHNISGPQHFDVLCNVNDFIEGYDCIFTHDKEILNLDHPNIKYAPNASNKQWIKEDGIHKKSKLISMINSGKNLSDGHKLRNYITEKYLDKIDLYGRNSNPIDKKEQGLNDYMFSFVVENGSYSTYFTEKILDCFATGTIPIYWGSPDIGEYFNIDGIVLLDDEFDISILNEDFYNNKLDAIKDNFERCMKQNIADNVIYDLVLESLNE